MRCSPPHNQTRAYHHGNLREALIEAALGLIAERGPAGFTFAEVARAAGVSAAAPYRHFRDRNALIAEIARQGFERFANDLKAAWREGKPDPVRAIENCGQAYLAFARREPAAYAAMFQPGLPIEQDATLLIAFDRAFGVLRHAAEVACQIFTASSRTGTPPGEAARPSPPALMVALHVWTMAHGIASLFIGSSDGARRNLPMLPEELLEAGLLIYLGSLGLTSHHEPRR